MSRDAIESSSGLPPSIAGLLCYLLMLPTFGLPASGGVFLMIERADLQIRFHAWQSIVLGAAWWLNLLGLWVVEELLARVWEPLGVLVKIVRWSIYLSLIASWVMCIIKSYALETWRIPILGRLAEQLAWRDKIRH